MIWSQLLLQVGANYYYKSEPTIQLQWCVVDKPKPLVVTKPEPLLAATVDRAVAAAAVAVARRVIIYLIIGTKRTI